MAPRGRAGCNGRIVLVAKPDLYGNAAVTVSPWAAFLAAMVATFLIAMLIGYPALRLRGHYLAMATLGFGLIVSKMLLGSNHHWSGGWHQRRARVEAGGRVDRHRQERRCASRTTISPAAWPCCCWCSCATSSTPASGARCRPSTTGETAANAMGINTAAYKLKVFVLSALLAAIAGVFFTHYTGGIGPSEAGAMKSVRYVALAAAGGMANLWGVTIMSIALNYFSLRGWFGSYDNAVFGVILILIISLAPEGPLKPLGQWLKRLTAKRPAPPPSTITFHVSRFTPDPMPGNERSRSNGAP